MSRHKFLVSAALLGLAACPTKTTIPKTTSEIMRGSSYFPLSPKPVTVSYGDEKTGPTSRDLLDSLPNETIRLSVGTIDETGTMTFGAGAVGQEGHSYEVVVDYVKYTTAYLPVCFSSLAKSDKGKFVAGEAIAAFYTPLGKVDIANDTHVDKQPQTLKSTEFALVHKVPIYIGVGLRIRATIQVLKGNVQLSLFGIGSAASAGNVSGTMVVQTLGVFGEPVSALLPLPSDVTQSSIQGAMQSLAALKAKLYGKDVGARPQVVGFETIFASPQAIQLIEATIEGSNVDAAYAAGELRAKPLDTPPGFCPAAQPASIEIKSPGRRGD